ncbi:MAG: regulatory protein RecX [Balneola sp.]|nr:regulatory protein RecX [Balneola sp.]MBO6651398.1 regulatory protein RecX [Balneola sp.]MBO6710975.1 regulatory protein RecX [Balneola sp.]MBO6801491.1 regulatory protein RecX [Balneola sp.]MBO6870395.1 regulatory protein RecX [Balneola sp.]
MSYSNKIYSKKEPELPVTIHRIEVQKKNSFRYSLYSENGFISGVSDATLTKQNLRKGTVIDEQLYAEIQKEEESWLIREYLIRLLGRRDHASHELRLKGIKKGFDSEILDQIIAELEEKSYINNYAFAKKYAHDKFRFNNWGPNKIKAELSKKKIGKSTITQVLEEEFDQQSKIETISELIEKKKPALLRTDPEKRRKKIFDYLFRKGYDSSIILKEIDGLLESLNK